MVASFMIHRSCVCGGGKLYLLCRSRRRRWVSSPQSSCRNILGSSFCRRCRFCMDSRSELPGGWGGHNQYELEHGFPTFIEPRHVRKFARYTTRQNCPQKWRVLGSFATSQECGCELATAGCWPCIRACTDKVRWRRGTRHRWRTSRAPGSRRRRNRGHRFRCSVAPPSPPGTCTRLSLGGSWREYSQSGFIS